MKVLFIGESWSVHMIHSKGFDSFTSTKYEEGATYLLQCLAESGLDVDYIRAHEVQIRFPTTIEELEKYDAIVLSDIGSNTFLLRNGTFYEMKQLSNALDLIRQYVDQGGGFLMIGGFLSFTGIEAKANYKKTVISDVLPVELLDFDDRIELPQGVSPTVVSSHQIINELGKEWPVFLGYNQLRAKPTSEVLLTINDDPMLTIGSFGQGKTAAFASDCAPHWGSLDFVNWENYKVFWVNLIQHISRTA